MFYEEFPFQSFIVHLVFIIFIIFFKFDIINFCGGVAQLARAHGSYP
jgi:hypothetical protein